MYIRKEAYQLNVIFIFRTVLLRKNREEALWQVTGEFGNFIDSKRKGRMPDGSDVKLKDIAEAMGKTATYLSDIIKGRRNPPEIELLEKIAGILRLDEKEKAVMYDLAGKERNEVAPDLPDYIMKDELPHARTALRTAKQKHLGDDFWKGVYNSALNEKGGNKH